MGLIVTLLILPYRIAAETHPIWQPKESVSTYKSRAQSYLTMNSSQLRNEVSTRGGYYVDRHNIEMVDRTYDLAAVAHLENNAAAARATITLLLRYNEVFPSWVSEFNNGVASGLYKRTGQVGIWTEWWPDDLYKP